MFRRLACLALGLALAGCAAPAIPDEFVAVERSHDALKAVAADDALYWVRAFRDDARGDLQFWREALRRHLETDRGYTLIEDRDAHVGEEPAAEMRFECTVDGLPRVYLIVLRAEARPFASHIETAEYTAPKDRFDAHLDAVRRAIGVE